MKKMPTTIYLSLLLVGLLSLTGCVATTIINRVPAPQVESSEQAQIKVCRQKIFIRDGTSTILSLDRKPILRSGPGICMSAKVIVGPHVLSVLAQGWAGMEIGELEFVLQGGQTKYFKFKLEELSEISQSEYSDFSGYEDINVQQGNGSGARP